MFPAEAEGLAALADVGVRVPAVHWVDEEGIVLDYLPPGPEDWNGLAAMLARLHRAHRPHYGWPQRVYLGTFPFPGRTGKDWTNYFVEQRVIPLVEATWNRLGRTGLKLERTLAHLRLPTEGPVLLHGDLWSGNVHMSREGAALLDPSVWIGERGVDVAMMRLFGGFPARFWEAYEALLPIPEEVRAAIPCYQIYYLLAHIKFFGDGYLGALRQALAACL